MNKLKRSFPLYQKEEMILLLPILNRFAAQLTRSILVEFATTGSLLWSILAACTI